MINTRTVDIPDPARERKVKTLTFAITDDCNLQCCFCVQKRGKQYLSRKTVRLALENLRGRLQDLEIVSFYGGEPLLGFDRIRQVVFACRERWPGKNIAYSVTTNGTLLTPDRIAFLDRHRFAVTLSLDGNRGVEETGYWSDRMELLRVLGNHEGIQSSVNLVVGPVSLHRWSGWVQELIEKKVGTVWAVMDIREVWDPASVSRLNREYGQLTDYLLKAGKGSTEDPLPGFSHRQAGLLVCSGGEDRLTVAPSGTLWGCHLTWDFFHRYPGHPGRKDFQLGNVENPDWTGISRYHSLKQCYFSAGERFCVNCPQVKYCYICPFTAGLVSGEIGVIPPHLCRLEKIRLLHQDQLLVRKGTANGDGENRQRHG